MFILSVAFVCYVCVLRLCVAFVCCVCVLRLRAVSVSCVCVLHLGVALFLAGLVFCGVPRFGVSVLMTVLYWYEFCRRQGTAGDNNKVVKPQNSYHPPVQPATENGYPLPP